MWLDDAESLVFVVQRDDGGGGAGAQGDGGCGSGWLGGLDGLGESAEILAVLSILTVLVLGPFRWSLGLGPESALVREMLDFIGCDEFVEFEDTVAGR